MDGSGWRGVEEDVEEASQGRACASVRGAQAYVGVGVDELAQRWVEGETLDAAALEADHELRRRAVHAVAGLRGAVTRWG